MEKAKFTFSDGSGADEFFVLEETKINGSAYILVVDSEEDDAECLILREVEESKDAEKCRKLSHYWRAAYQSYSLYGQRRQSGRGSGSASLFLSAMSRTAGRYRANRGEYLYPIKRLREIRGYYGKF